MGFRVFTPYPVVFRLKRKQNKAHLYFPEVPDILETAKPQGITECSIFSLLNTVKVFFKHIFMSHLRCTHSSYQAISMNKHIT